MVPSFTTIGPKFYKWYRYIGAIVATVTDSGASDPNVVQLFTNNTIVAIVSKDATFTPQSAISGFATIVGVQLSVVPTTSSKVLQQIQMH